MDLATYQREIAALSREIRAGMVLAAAGLAADKPYCAQQMKDTDRIRLDFPYNQDLKPVHAFGGGVQTFWYLVQALLADSPIRAPASLCADPKNLARGCEHLYLPGPGDSISAHEIIEATAILENALSKRGLSGVELARFLELRA